ncbi:hypothetical protein XENTR_v10013114 [Xenopus tropicalis]|uniref:Dynein regulatory complex subunit 5 n=1 Tax=Xenopus tropicalis TaxID=8364 RepID=F7D3M8_XENTR|nr:dynein regulatory complex subunit 5 [Xenopus tropicalis]XP_012819451.2 dynein regulatory complex subunit 5 [Xenopus tropicalis]KAE8600168.1 hypothetical protein XENTR_v10013114 [Xenopus tropicalis]KAE8600169.1 hypothetical protein XENTR_v10013114 [Xenopus tropicalis]
MIEAPPSVRGLVPAPLPVGQRNPAADPRRMRRIIAEDPTWSLAIVPLLSDLCLQHIVTNFAQRPTLERLLPKHRVKVLERLSPSLPLQVTANLIGYEQYWRRCCTARWPVCDISSYGGSWKRLFFERNLEHLIERFIPDVSDTDPVLEAAELSRDFVKKLDIKELLPPVKLETKKDAEEDELSDTGSEAGIDLPSMDHFDLGLVAPLLPGLEELHLVYGVRNCGMNFEWNLFRFTDRDCNSLAQALRVFRNLKVFRLHKSKVDDDKACVLVRSLLNHPALVHLDLSHNQVSDRGARAIAKLLKESALRVLDLSNNNVGAHGAQALAHALTNNWTLRNLSLRLNHVGNEGGQALCNALLPNQTLQELHLGSNELSEPTASALSQALTHNGSLRRLSLACNRIGPDGGKQLLEGMSDNETLLELDLRLTEIGQESEFFINQVLKNNRERAQGEEHNRPLSSS